MRYILPYILSITLVAMISSCRDAQKKPSANLRVGVLPYENFSPELTDTMVTTLQNIYGISCSVLPSQTLPAKSFTKVKTPRYRADIIIDLLHEHKPDSLDYILALTSKDISTTKYDESGDVKEPAEKYSDWGVMGLGYCPGPSCIVSTFRLQHNNQKLFMSRFKKVCVHEMGHNFGLPHCESRHCVMRDAAETIKTIDHVQLSLCSKCKAKLQMQ